MHAHVTINSDIKIPAPTTVIGYFGL